jgi:hypothetical protein
MINSMAIHVRLGCWALVVLLKAHDISIRHRLRMWIKTIHIYSAFLGLTDHERPPEQVSGAMVCAVLSAVYDHDTDWVRVDDPDRSAAFRLLDRMVENPVARDIAKDLFRRDWAGTLGIERGGPAMRFYCLVIRSRWMAHYSQQDIEAFGCQLQIVDDIIDFGKDKKAGNTNCFLTTERQKYLTEAHEILACDFFKELARNSWVWVLVGGRCRAKLKALESLPAETAIRCRLEQHRSV